MTTVSISVRFRVTIPRAAREHLGLRPGQKMQVLAYDGRIELLPVRPAASLRGRLRGISTRVPRDGDRA